MSGKSYEHAKAVVKAAKAKPKRYGKYAKQMDATGKVAGAYRAMQRAQTAERIRAERQRRREVASARVERGREPSASDAPEGDGGGKDHGPSWKGKRGRARGYG